jgi:hypothetical protein
VWCRGGVGARTQLPIPFSSSTDVPIRLLLLNPLAWRSQAILVTSVVSICGLSLCYRPWWHESLLVPADPVYPEPARQCLQQGQPSNDKGSNGTTVAGVEGDVAMRTEVEVVC